MRMLWLLFNFDGRIGRLSYWLGCLVVMVVSVIPYAALAAMGRLGLSFRQMDSLSIAAALFLMAAFFIFLTIMNLALVAKRLHDRDKSLLWYLLVLIPIIGPIWMMIELGFLSGSPDMNRYGAPPYAFADADDSDADADAIVSRWRDKQRSTADQSRTPAVIERLTGPDRNTGGRPQFGRRGLS